MRFILYPLSFSVFFAAGCAGPSGSPSAPKPGSGIIEYRQVARQAHEAVSGAVVSLEALKPNSAPGSSELARFDRAFDELEFTSVKCRARAEAIIARGQSYFDEWKEHLAGVTNKPSTHAPEISRLTDSEYNRLYDHFTRVRQRSGEVREQFRPFMANLRQYRAHLDRKVGRPVPSAPPHEADLTSLAASGRRVLKTLDSVLAALDDAETELRATLAAKP